MNLPGILCTALSIFWALLIVRIILTWVRQVPEPIQPAANFVMGVTDPVLRPFRGLLPPVQIGAGALDLSPLLLFLLLGFVQRIVCDLTGGGLFQ